MGKSSVSAIIVNYNGKHLLKEAIGSVKRSMKKSGLNSELIILDNASTDGSREFIRKNYKGIRLVSNKENLGYSGINNALKHCRGDYIFFLNNDLKMDSNCIKNMVNAMDSDDSIGQACPRFINYYDKSLKSGGTWVSRSFYSGHIKGTGREGMKEVPYLGIAMVRKDVVWHYGYLFDPDYFIYAEDLDLGLRIRLMGKRSVFVPDAIIYHMHSATMQKVEDSRKIFMMERNLFMTFFKILSLKNIIILLPYALFVRLLAIAKETASGKFRNAFARIWAILWIASNFSMILEKRKAAQKLRKASDNYILRIFTEKYLFARKFLV
ncbi:glycosyltransferase family 2 protein [Candidatus Woesearchaeota archaeon]|nr:glycosyltransferase family 2 protein [Candidatus Woesearchaeota archaeon]